MRTELVTIATDTTPLDGAFYQPDDGRAWNAALLLHGNTMNFYTGPPRFLPPALTSLGLACLAFNRRGHDILGIRDSFAAEGGAFQLTREAIADNRYAAEWLAMRGFPDPVVIGHSNGGMLAVRHCADRPQTRALVLMSAHAGGRNLVAMGSKAGLLAGDRLDEITARARELVAAGRGRELMLMPGWWYVVTAQTFLDFSTELPDIVELAPQVRCPVLFLRGDREPKHIYPGEDFCARAAGPCEMKIVADCDHFYAGRELAVSELIAEWLKRTVAHAGGERR